MTSGGNNFNYFAENQLTKFSARDAGDFSDAYTPYRAIGLIFKDIFPGLSRSWNFKEN